MQEKQRQFSSASPKELIRALKAVDVLLHGTPLEIAAIPLSKGAGTFRDALNVVQDKAEVEEEWVREARVKWIELGLVAWEEWLSKPPSHQDLQYSSLSDARLAEQFPQQMTYDTLVFFITPRYVGEDCNRLLDRLLTLLKRLEHVAGIPLDHAINKEVKRLIQKRTGCARPNDPHRDETACKLLMEHYRMEP